MRFVGRAEAIWHGNLRLPCQCRWIIPAGFSRPTGGEPQAELHAESIHTLDDFAGAVRETGWPEAREVGARIDPARVESEVVEAHVFFLPIFQDAEDIQGLLVIESWAWSPLVVDAKGCVD